MAELTLGEDDFAGLDLEGDADDAVLGAIMRQRIKQQRGVPRRPAIRQQATPMTGKRVPLGMPSLTFAAASGTSIAVEVEPQRGYQAERLIVALLRTGATATGLVRVSSIKIGDVEQLPSGNPVTTELFRADGVDLELDLTMCPAGVKMRVEFQISAAPGAADTVLVDPAFKGRVIGQ